MSFFSSLRAVGKIFLPNRCAVCENDTDQILCLICQALCRHCDDRSLSTLSLFWYEDTVRYLILNAKFHQKFHCATLVVHLATKALVESTKLNEISQFEPQALVVIPSRRISILRRGFDLNYLFALKLSQLLNVPVVRLLKRAFGGQNLASTRNKIDRAEAVKESFKLERMGSFERILLVDDIVTTGTTLNEAKRTLAPLQAKVMCLTIAKTELDIA